MAFQVQKLFGTFEKQAPGVIGPLSDNNDNDYRADE